MAHSEAIWSKARGFYEAGLSLAKIKEKTGIARNTISKRAKKEQWEQGRNADYVDATVIIADKKGTEREQSLLCADEVAYDVIRRKNLVYGTQEKALQKINEIMDNGTKLVKVSIGPRVQELKEVGIDSGDMKNIVDAVDKASITLGVNERHAKPANVQQNTQNNTVARVTFRRATKADRDD